MLSISIALMSRLSRHFITGIPCWFSRVPPTSQHAFTNRPEETFNTTSSATRRPSSPITSTSINNGQNSNDFDFDPVWMPLDDLHLHHAFGVIYLDLSANSNVVGRKNDLPILFCPSRHRSLVVFHASRERSWSLLCRRR